MAIAMLIKRTVTILSAYAMALLPALSVNGAELEPSSIKFRLGMRYNSQFDKQTLDQLSSWFQFRATIDYALGLAATPAGDFTLRGMAGTGPTYTVSWNSFASTMGQAVPDQVFNMRQIYLQDDYEGWRGQVGVIPPNGGDIPTLGYDVDGWVTGGRLVAPLGDGDFEMVTGIIDHLKDPNAFQSWNEWNYLGLKLRQPLPWWELKGSLSYEYLMDTPNTLQTNKNTYGGDYVGFELSRKWTLDEGMTLVGAGEVIHNFSTPSWAWAAAAKFSMKPITVAVAYTYINPDFGLRGELSNDFFILGHRASLNLGGDVLFKGLKWFVNTDLGEQKMRVRAGFTYAFGDSAPGYLARFN